MRMNRCIMVLFFLFMSVLNLQFGQTQDQEVVEIVFAPDMSLRGIAGQYLGNPNEWEMLLYYNGLQELADLQPGMKLNIPVGLFRRTMHILEQVAEKSRLANMEGAGALVSATIAEALRLQTQAANLKNAGDLLAAEKTAREALEWSEKALYEARSKKIRSVSATLKQKEGSVQSRKPDQSVWTEAVLEQLLSEQERVRTLAASLAGILFVDGSRISLSEHSLAVIGTMKENLIKRSFQANVTVLEGDLLAHLSALGGRKEFTINTPGVETTIRSRKFRTSRDEAQATRIANYDGEIDVEANQGKVTLKKDEGTKVEQGKRPETPKKLLPPPVMIRPTPGQTVFTTDLVFEWEAQEQARAYQLEISASRNFETLLENKRLTAAQYVWRAPQKGVYYYRLYAVDQDDLIGPYSEPFGVYVDLDTTPPFLTVQMPADGFVSVSADVTVEGTVEQGALLTINATPVAYDDEGAFTSPITLNVGENLLTVIATDAAQNTTTIQRRINYAAAEQLFTLNIPESLTINTPQITLTGERQPQTRMEIDAAPVELPEHFTYMLTLPEGEHALTVQGIAPDGKSQTRTLRITVDLTPPEIRMDDAPTATREPMLLLAGEMTEPVTLNIAGVTVPIQEQRFELPLALREGENVLTLTVTDRAGNVTTKTLRVRLDTTPPEIANAACSIPDTKGGEIITCTVNAVDAGVGLARTGSFSLIVTPDNQVVKGILTLNPAKAMFEGSVFIPAGVKGKVAVQTVLIQDRLRNEATR